MSDVRIGVDLGGTKIEAVVLRHSPERDEPEVLTRARVPTDRERGYEHIVSATRLLVAQVAREAQVDAKCGRRRSVSGCRGPSRCAVPTGSSADTPLVKN